MINALPLDVFYHVAKHLGSGSCLVKLSSDIFYVDPKKPISML
jgi:hypothetical protein